MQTFWLAQAQDGFEGVLLLCISSRVFANQAFNSCTALKRWQQLTVGADTQ